MLFQNAAQRRRDSERRMDPAVRDREVRLHAQRTFLHIDCCILIEECLVAVSEWQHNVKGDRTLPFGTARSAFIAKTHSAH